jgi:hypothetical protein
MAKNGISTLSTKQAKQAAKLELAKLKRKGYTLNADGTVASGPDTTANFYRARNDFDITELPTQYSGNNITDNPNVGGLVIGRPWITPVVVLAGNIIMETSNDLLLENGNQIYTEV